MVRVTQHGWRLVILAVVAAAAVALTVALAGQASRPASAVTPLEPNLKALPASQLSIVTSGGSKFLRLSTTTWNSGDGALDLRGGAVVGPDEQEVYQRVYQSDGTYLEYLAGSFVYHPTHNHTHFDDYAIYRLESLSGAPESVSVKTTFCIIDTEPVDLSLPGAPQTPVYTTCGNDIQGMSVGWGDRYSYALPGQALDITGFPNGDYYLTIEADPLDRIIEVDDADNNSTIVVRIIGNSVTVVPSTPTPTPTPTATSTPSNTPTNTSTPTQTPIPNVEPAVTAEALPPGGEAPLSFNLNWTASDADGDPLTVTIDWDDGTSNVVSVTSPYPAQSNPHTFAAAGAYDVAVTADDANGGASQAIVRVLVGPDGDGDLVPDAYDNCPAVSNADQANTDAAPLDNGPLAPDDDVTILAGDTLGDACDSDADNDGLLDATETAGPPCSSATGATDPLRLDSDGDHLQDGWECVTGSNPADAASGILGSGSADADGDRIIDIWEERGYAGSGATADADGDGCHDLVELASVDGNATITDVDRLAVARRALAIWPAHVLQDYVLDLDRNGVVGDPDRLFAARAALLDDWQPKACA